MATKLNVLNNIFLPNTLDFAFQKWKSQSIVTHLLRKRSVEKYRNAVKNPNNLQREKSLRFWKGMLIMQNK